MVIENSENFSPVEAPTRQGIGLRTVTIGGLLLLLLGIFGGGWAMKHFASTVPNLEQPQNGAAVPTVAPALDAAVAPAPAYVAPHAPVDADVLAIRVGDLEQRLGRISLEAQSASGNATRAEGLLVAFAVRRALDRGLPLGYLEPQLRLRFGDAQPNAVKTILDTARDPVTIEQLRGELEALSPQLLGGIGGDANSFWTAVRRELGELLVLRSAGSQSTNAYERMERARRYLTAAQVDKAISEVEAMPGSGAAGDWLIDARRFHEARRALDLIETAAILEPRESSAMPAESPDGAVPPAAAAAR